MFIRERESLVLLYYYYNPAPTTVRYFWWEGGSAVQCLSNTILGAMLQSFLNISANFRAWDGWVRSPKSTSVLCRYLSPS